MFDHPLSQKGNGVSMDGFQDSPYDVLGIIQNIHPPYSTYMVSLAMQGSEESAATLAHLTPAMSSNLARAKFV